MQILASGRASTPIAGFAPHTPTPHADPDARQAAAQLEALRQTSQAERLAAVDAAASMASAEATARSMAVISQTITHAQASVNM